MQTQNKHVAFGDQKLYDQEGYLYNLLDMTKD